MPGLYAAVKAVKSAWVVNTRFKQSDTLDGNVAAIAIDSTGLKRFGKDEWHQEKHKVNAKRSWRKAHFAVGSNHLIQGAELTGKDIMDDQVVEAICDQVTENITHVTADKMYDTNSVFQTVESHFPDTDIVISPKGNTFADEVNYPKRMSNLVAYFALGDIGWQKRRHYDQRNGSETAMQRYKKIIGNTLHSRVFKNQRQEMLIGCSNLNRFTLLRMPNSYRVT